MGKYEEIYAVVRKIPKGKVATYGQIAKQLKVQNAKLKFNPRLVGRALHKNPYPKIIPCHRVVDRNGKIADSFAFGGAREQRKRLLEEGVGFKDTMHVDLGKCFWGISVVK
ncbi:MGMT family protein [Candidatus Microgenomates bacterium]|nr:MGMT family protein [Candidatus Microgenomates bacterium]